MMIDTCHHISKQISNVTRESSNVLFMPAEPCGILGKLWIVAQNEAKCLLSNLIPNSATFQNFKPLELSILSCDVTCHTTQQNQKADM